MLLLGRENHAAALVFFFAVEGWMIAHQDLATRRALTCRLIVATILTAFNDGRSVVSVLLPVEVSKLRCNRDGGAFATHYVAQRVSEEVLAFGALSCWK